MNKIYMTKSITISKSLARVYNKHPAIAEYEYQEDTNNLVLVKVIDFDEKETKKHTFDGIIYWGPISPIPNDNLERFEIKIGTPGARDYKIFSNYEKAKASKLLELEVIKIHFENKIDELRASFRRNFPKDFEKHYDTFFDENPQYLI